MKIPDAHCHVDQLAAVAGEGVLSSLGPTIAVTNDWLSFLETKTLSSGRRDVFVSLGLHPKLVLRNSEDIPLILNQIQACHFVGEIGLDFRGRVEEDDIRSQESAFRAILNACERSRKVINIHSAGAEGKVVDTLLSYKLETVIMHWYTGPLHLLRIGIDQGWYFSVPPAVGRSKRLQRSLERIPLDRLLVESDAPNGLHGHSIHKALRRVTQEISRVKAASLAHVRDQIERSFAHITRGDTRSLENQTTLPKFI